MLIVRKIESADKVQVKRLEHGWLLNFEAYGLSFEFDEKLIDFSPDFAHLVVGNDGPFLLWSSEVNESKSGFGNALHRNHAFGLRQLASFFVDEHGLSHCFVMSGEVTAEGIEPAEIDNQSSVSAEDVFSAFLPDAALAANRLTAKKKLLAHIKPEDSLAMLEAQLDLLSLAVLGNEEAKAALSDAIQENNVTTVHTIDKLKQTILRQKAHIRKEQIAYFTARGEAKNGDLSS